MNQEMQFSFISTGWEAYGQSVMYYEKEKNGDHLLLEDIKPENILVSIVADGITKQPCDWLASELTCNKFLEFFLKCNSFSIKDRIKESINLTNNYLLSIIDKCQGLASTLSMIVYEYDKEDFYFVNMGDSRIYKISNGSILQLTRDDLIKTKRNVQTLLGIQTKDLATLTNHVGREYPEIIIHEGNFHSGDLLLLASDGFYEARKSSFEKDLIELSRSENLQPDFNKLFSKFQILAFDDMTALVIRKIKGQF